MEYVGSEYKYNDWLLLVWYTWSMHRYIVALNYIQLLENNMNKGATMYIDGRPKASRNITWFINSTWTGTTHKLPNCIFEGHEGKCVFICAIKSIVVGEGLLIDYNLNQIDGGNYLIQHLTQPLFNDLLFFSCNNFNYMYFSFLICLDSCIVAGWLWLDATSK